jgi:phosphoglucosamine mutase
LGELAAAAAVPPLGGARVVVDCADGAASAFAPVLLAGVGARVTAVHARPDGININRGCGAVHPEGMAARVRRERAAFGVAFDGDGDRAVFSDENGRIRDGDDVLFLAARWMARRGELARRIVVGTGMTNYGLERAFRRRRIALRRAPVGDRFVAEEMVRSGAMLGGEPSGHVIDRRRTPTGDGLLTALLVARILVEEGLSLGRAADGWERLPQLLLNVPVARKPPLEEVPALVTAVEEARRALEGRGRLLVRYSGTEPLLRIMVEGPSEVEVKGLARKLRETVERHLGD